ncbi:uncharacterized protein ASCRUDRAFT_67438 [Ascoidea rubescens DSM 1968]|uniref:Borealin N-terminal domain-containing protein n=1 Tax=Ascoidea rubescens DSM 1968 TaxID=1344418 RepID=A0A1D2VNZ1_9ASCO|nr:hypothetical protein ASCRUDRAFT_67438 [Ascoidea rubescens DSM 1968]ODV63323.1 hypothetical protein ASCRUDRAFT_67438 [Ascoidea rubescens DSM 1968]
MANKFTPEQRNKLAERLELNISERKKAMAREYQEIADNLEERLKYRLNRIPNEFKSLKIKDIIQLERTKQINFATLIADIRNLKQNLIQQKTISMHQNSRFQNRNGIQRHPRRQTRQKLPQIQLSNNQTQLSNTGNNEGIRLRLRSAKDRHITKTQNGVQK